MQCKAAPHQIAFACALMFDDNNTIIIRHKFCIMPPPLLLKECKDNISKFELLGSHKIVGSDGSKDQDLHQPSLI